MFGINFRQSGSTFCESRSRILQILASPTWKNHEARGENIELLVKIICVTLEQLLSKQKCPGSTFINRDPLFVKVDPEYSGFGLLRHEKIMTREGKTFKCCSKSFLWTRNNFRTSENVQNRLLSVGTDYYKLGSSFVFRIEFAHPRILAQSGSRWDGYKCVGLRKSNRGRLGNKVIAFTI